MKPLIAVIDYEMGNLHSVSKALEKAGARVSVTSSPSVIRAADAVVLPGVGAFGEAAQRLRQSNLIAPILEALEKNRPFWGFVSVYNFFSSGAKKIPARKASAFLKGSVTRFKWPKTSRLKIPHMGWNTVQSGPAKTSILKGLSQDSYFYFVHSFFPAPKDPALVSTRTEYGGSFCSSVACGRLFASQFHPEKSGNQGHRLLTNFVREVSQC